MDRQDHLAASDMARRVKMILLGSAGNLVEWFDFYAYAAFALYFAPSFFPSDDPVVQQLNAALLFAFGFIVRPIGGWLFGYFADRYGRRKALTSSVLLMCLGSLVIAIAPTYAQVGVWAPVILALARVVQGLSLGGQYGTSATYLSEVAHPKHRGFFSSFQYVTIIGGQLTAIIVLLVLQRLLLTTDELKEWGWRVPFFIGGALAIVTAVMQKHLHETDQFIAAKKSAEGAGKALGGLRQLLKYPKEIAIVVGLTMGGTTAFYTYTTYMQKYLKLSVGLTEEQTTMVTAASLVFALLLQPAYGALSDKIGRRPLLIFFGVAGTLFTIPILTTLQNAQGPWDAFFLIAAAWVIVSGYTSINAVVKAELFPTAVRAIGVGLPYAITVAVFGGSSESLALYFKTQGHETWFYYYLTAIIGASLLVYVFMRDTRSDSAMNRHE